jgi:hypothetical protein
MDPAARRVDNGELRRFAVPLLDRINRLFHRDKPLQIGRFQKQHTHIRIPYPSFSGPWPLPAGPSNGAAYKHYPFPGPAGLTAGHFEQLIADSQKTFAALREAADGIAELTGGLNSKIGPIADGA